MRRAEIEDLSRKVNALLTLYVGVHNELYARPWWKTLLGRPIPFEKLEVQIAEIETALKHGSQLIVTLRHGATRHELKHLSHLTLYISSLLNAVTLLRRILIALKAKSEGEPYQLKEYNTDCDAYQAAEREYIAVGKDLNESWRDFVANRPESEKGIAPLHRNIQSSVDKSAELQRFSHTLGAPPAFEPAAFGKYMRENEEALDAMLNLIEADVTLMPLLAHYGATREKLSTIYKTLCRYGGEWALGHWVPASALCFGTTLPYILVNADSKDESVWMEMGEVLINYFATDSMTIIPPVKATGVRTLS
jgi:hypothetical protein